MIRTNQTDAQVGPVIDYYCSPSSPWTYLGHGRLVRIAEKHRVKINIKPIDLVNCVFPASGGLPVSQRPKQRLAYREIELRRWSAHLDIRLNLKPKKFPVSCDLASRLIIAIDLASGTQKALELTGRILAGVWANDLDISDAATLLKIGSGVSIDSKCVLAMASTEEIARHYVRYTQEAIERQVFGAPFYIFQDEPFWGQDRLELLEHALKNQA